MKHYLSTVVILLLFKASIAQTHEVGDWQKKHPTVIFVQEQDYTTELAEQFNAKNIQVLVYAEEITMKLIDAYTSDLAQQTNSALIERSDDGSQIKVWLAENQGLKIVPRSMFEAQNEEQQLLLTNSDAMILSGEKLTLQDIENYENTH